MDEIMTHDRKRKILDIILKYEMIFERIREIEDNTLRSFDIHRLTFPNDYNFNAFLNIQPEYQSAIMDRNDITNVLSSFIGEFDEKILSELKKRLND